MDVWPGVIEGHSFFLRGTITENSLRITLGEGNTPLVKAVRLPGELGFRGELWFKQEFQNPSGSFKDRGMVVAVSKALEGGFLVGACASTGNTLASAALYGARFGMKIIGIVSRGNVARGKLAQADRAGAKIIQIDGTFDDALQVVKDLTTNYKIAILNSLNPNRIEGQKTAAIEIVRQLGGKMPYYHFIPVGNGGNMWAYWVGYKESRERQAEQLMSQHVMDTFYPLDMEALRDEALFHLLQHFGSLPKMMGYQAEGAAPIVRGAPVRDPKTIASAIRIGNPARWKEAERARDESSGLIDSVSDTEILEAGDLLSRSEGIQCEPASAACFAGFVKALGNGQVQNSEGITVTCTLTGHFLKDQQTPESRMNEIPQFPADADMIARYVGVE